LSYTRSRARAAYCHAMGKSSTRRATRALGD